MPPVQPRPNETEERKKSNTCTGSTHNTIVYTLNVYVPFSLFLSFFLILFISLHTWYSIRCLIPFVSLCFFLDFLLCLRVFRSRTKGKNPIKEFNCTTKTTIVSKSIENPFLHMLWMNYNFFKKINEQTSQELKQIICNWLCDRKTKNRVYRKFFDSKHDHDDDDDRA